MSLKATLTNSYRSSNTGRKMFVFKVTGSEAELKEYLAAQEARAGKEFNFTDEDGTPLFWTDRPTGKVMDLKITTNGNVVIDTTELDLHASMKAQADYQYNQVYARLGGIGSPAAIPTPAPAGGEKID